MRAITFYEYGGPSVLKLEERPDTVPGRGQVLVGVRACSLNAADWHILRADPFVARFAVGLFKPRYNVLGCDLSGVVEAVGPDVTRFKVGDSVMGELGSSGELRRGERVLVNGASGGVGTFAVQLAKALGGKVTAVCSPRNAPLAPAGRFLMTGGAGKQMAEAIFLGPFASLGSGKRLGFVPAPLPGCLSVSPRRMPRRWQPWSG